MGLQDEYFAGQAKAAGKKFKTTNATERTKNEGKYLEKVKKISNEGKKAVPKESKEAKEVLYPICPMLSRGSHLHRCINTECVAYGDRFCRALNTKVITKLI